MVMMNRFMAGLSGLDLALLAEEGDGFLDVHQSAGDGDENRSPDGDIADDCGGVKLLGVETAAVIHEDQDDENCCGLEAHFKFSAELCTEGFADVFHAAAKTGD